MYVIFIYNVQTICIYFVYTTFTFKDYMCSADICNCEYVKYIPFSAITISKDNDLRLSPAKGSTFPSEVDTLLWNKNKCIAQSDWFKYDGRFGWCILIGQTHQLQMV